MVAYANSVWFVAGSSGTADFSDGTGINGYLNMAGGGLVNGQTYSYRAVHPTNPAIFENGRGVYNSGTGVLSRATQYETSDAGAKVDFAAAPVVAVVPLAVDLDEKVPTSRSLTAGNGLTGGGDLSADRSFAVGAGTGILSNADDVAIDKASEANVRSAASNKVVTSDLIESASAAVPLTDATTIALDWDAFINGEVTVTTNRILGNPTNGQPGTWRTVLVKSDGGPDALTFGNQFGGSVPTLDDITTTKFYLLGIFCKTATQFLAFANDGSDA